MYYVFQTPQQYFRLEYVIVPKRNLIIIKMET